MSLLDRGSSERRRLAGKKFVLQTVPKEVVYQMIEVCCDV